MTIFRSRSIWLYVPVIITLYLLSYFSLVAIGDKRYVCIAPSGFDTIVTWPAYCYSEDLHEIHNAAESGIHPELTVTGYIFYPLIYIQEIAHIHSFYHTMNDQERRKFESDGFLGNVDVHDVNNSRYFVDNGKHIENPMLSMDLSNAPEYEDAIRHLLSTQWNVLYSGLGNRHAIKFEINGKISVDGDLGLHGHGSWRFRKDKLEIYSEFGELYYVFVFDKELNEYRSTDEATRHTIMVPFSHPELLTSGFVLEYVRDNSSEEMIKKRLSAMRLGIDIKCSARCRLIIIGKTHEEALEIIREIMMELQIPIHEHDGIIDLDQ
jgi:hypothetical protein